MEFGILDLFVQLIIIVVALIFTGLITIPFVGIIVRFRANYNPKGLQLDAEGGATPHTGPIVKSLFAMFMRVKRLEGWSGLYKGFMPNIISTSVVLLFATILVGPVVGSGSGAHSKYAAPVDGPVSRLLFSLFMIAVSLPVVVISNRSITTPFKLPWLNAPYALRILLTRAERRRPWLLYLTPGLFLSEILRVVYVFLVWDPLSSFIIPPSMKDDSKPFQNVTMARLTILMGLIFVSTLVICPLEVISTRLSIQRNNARTGMESEGEDDDALLQGAAYAGSDEDVIGLRSEDDPYLGFMDCATRIIHEEGYATLLRAWWLVAVSLLFTGIAK